MSASERRESLIETPAGVLKLAVRSTAAAAMLGISRRLLWVKTNDGTIPHFKINNAVLYGVEQLREWVAEQVEAERRKRETD